MGVWIAGILILVIVLAGCVLVVGTRNTISTHEEPNIGLVTTEKTTAIKDEDEK